VEILKKNSTKRNNTFCNVFRTPERREISEFKFEIDSDDYFLKVNFGFCYLFKYL